ncbi:hypothetical protein [Actinocorallia libanotica]|uniref:Uncharacterized protein n=1 Tax=Actinocorallia libanotica TaxID=46162 RepID=A0ABP4AJV9_9ACTN
MNEHDYGALRAFEVVWKSGHIETIQGHRVQYSGGDTFAVIRADVEKPGVLV